MVIIEVQARSFWITSMDTQAHEMDFFFHPFLIVYHCFIQHRIYSDAYLAHIVLILEYYYCANTITALLHRFPLVYNEEDVC